MRYKIVKVDERQKDFMAKYKARACTYCDYTEGFLSLCTFKGKKCPAGKEEYLTKIHDFKNKKL